MIEIDAVQAPSRETREALEARRWRWQNALMAWLVSLVVHGLLTTALGYFAGQRLFGVRRAAFDSLVGDSSGTLVAGFSNASGDMRRGEPFFDDEVPAGKEAGSSAEAGASSSASAAS